MLGCCRHLFLFLRETIIIKSVVVDVVVVFRGPVPQHRRSGEQADRDECDCSSRRAFGRRSTRKHTTTTREKSLSLSVVLTHSLSLPMRALVSNSRVQNETLLRTSQSARRRKRERERESGQKKEERGEKRKRKKSVACLSLEVKGVSCRRVSNVLSFYNCGILATVFSSLFSRGGFLYNIERRKARKRSTPRGGPFRSRRSPRTHRKTSSSCRRL